MALTPGSPPVSALGSPGRCTGLTLLAAVGTMLLSTAAAAQHVEICELPSLDMVRVRGVLAVELGETVSVLAETACENEEISIRFREHAAGPVTRSLELSLADVVPEARGRFVALVIAEMARTPNASAAARAGVGVRPQERLPVVDPARLLGTPSAVSLSAVFGSSAVSTYRHDSEADSHGDADSGRDVDPVMLFGSAGSRLFVAGKVTPLVGIAATVTWRKLSVHLDFQGTVSNDPNGTIFAWQNSIGVGVLLASVDNQDWHLDLRLRGEFGIGVATANAGPDAVSSTLADWVAAGMLNPSLMFEIGEGVELGVQGNFGLQRGYRVLDSNGSPLMELNGAFAELQVMGGSRL